MGDAPAFQFYPSDWILGTLTFSPAEDGAYLRCVMQQWASGGVPADDRKALAGVMRVSEKDAARLWATVSVKFQRGDDGLWRNARVEAEREKQRLYREVQAENGRRSAAARAARTGNDRSTTVEPPLNHRSNEASNEPPASGQRLGQPTPQPISTLQSSSSSSFSDPPSKNDGGVRGGGFVSPLEFEKLRRFNAYVGARLRVPNKLHSDFIAALGGENPDGRLRAWYAEVDAEIEVSGEAILPDVWKWLEGRFKPWATTASAEDAMAKWVAGA